MTLAPTKNDNTVLKSKCPHCNGLFTDLAGHLQIRKSFTQICVDDIIPKKKKKKPTPSKASIPNSINKEKLKKTNPSRAMEKTKVELNINLKTKEEIKKKIIIGASKNKKPVKSLEESPLYLYPEYYNIIPCRIEPYLDKDGNKIVKFPIKWEKYKTEKYPKEKLHQDIQTFGKKGKYNSLAVVCGAISKNLIPLDFDLKKGYNSEDFYNKIIKQIPILKNTLTEKSYRGGYHFHLLVDDMSCYESLDKKKISKTIFGKCCNEIGIHGERKLVFIWSGNKYKIINKAPPLKITNEEFSEIIETIKTPKIKKETKLTISGVDTLFSNKKIKLPKVFDILNQEHKDVLTHKIDIADYCDSKKGGTGIDEFHYWKDLFWQVYTKTGLTHEQLYLYLKKQSHFNISTIETQLKYDYHDYKLPLKTKNNPNGKFIKKSVKELYPDYETKKKKNPKKKEKEILYDAYEIADLILKKHTIKTLGKRKADYCLYKKGVYERGQLNSIETIISNILKELEIPFSLNKNNEILKLIANETYIDK